ncbi:MAG TPA: adenylate/guanylate cyclase domain-containing protein [Thermopolyspora sp.]
MSRRPTAEDIERVFRGAPARYTGGEAARAAGVSPELAERIWRALGFATLADDTAAFTDADVATLRRVKVVLAKNLWDERVVVRMARALGQTTARLAQWQTEIMIGTMLDSPGRPGDEEATRVFETAESLLPELEKMLVHVWRTQVAAAAGRLLAIAEVTDEVLPSRPPMAVGFADLVSFTRFSRELDEMALAELVEGFEARASDVVASYGGRLVKTLGDEVLFTATAARAAAEIALDLVEAIHADGNGPDVRAGLAYGPILPTMGDVFGPTVNLAARLTTIARPATIIVDSAMAERLAGLPGLDVCRIRRRPARGLGTVQPYVLRRAEPVIDANGRVE